MDPPRRVPEALKEPLKKELDSLVGQGILAKVTEPTDWVNSLVWVTKNTGALRLCLDPKDLNQAIKRPHYFTPTLAIVSWNGPVSEPFYSQPGNCSS